MRLRDLTAAEWVIRRDRGLTASEVEALAEWLAADPQNVAEYSRISAGWQKMDGIGAAPLLSAMANDAVARAKAGRSRRWVRTGALIATAAAVAAMFVLSRQAPSVAAFAPAPVKNYRVLASTASRVALPDGSVALLNGDSRIATDFTPAERRVRLLRGEAHFEVAKNPARPFIVSAGPVRIRAVGTAFKVLLTEATVEVLVTEGKIGVRSGSQSAAPLVAGERGIVRTSAGAKPTVLVDRPASTEIDAALAWESPCLVFNHTPLDQVVAAFNRYNARQFVLADSSLRTRTLTGVFRADNFDGFTRLLLASVDVVAEAQGDRVTLLRAAR